MVMGRRGFGYAGVGIYNSRQKIVVVKPGPIDKWEYLAMNLKSDPLPNISMGSQRSTNARRE